jgi:hypothetical protein
LEHDALVGKDFDLATIHCEDIFTLLIETTDVDINRINKINHRCIDTKWRYMKGCALEMACTRGWIKSVKTILNRKDFKLNMKWNDCTKYDADCVEEVREYINHQRNRKKKAM